MCNSDCFREAIKNKTVLFGSIDPTVGGWGRVDPNFYKSLFLWFLSKISCKFTVNDLNLKKNSWGGWVVNKFGSIVLLVTQILLDIASNDVGR